MTRIFSVRTGFALTIAIVVIIGCAAAMLADGSTGSSAFAAPGAMGGWQCSKALGILTVCTRQPHVTPASNCPSARRANPRPA
jgi:hypothetical protein